MTNKEYVLGFMFSPDGQKVVLIHKLRPEFQAGKLNGVGGKIEPNEHYIDAMTREFLEETSVETQGNQWEYYASMNLIGGSIIYVFKCFTEAYSQVVSPTDEQVSIFDVNALPLNIMPNLKVLIPLALGEFKYTELYESL
jgi:8-oxo-dGTP diphosphatase